MKSLLNKTCSFIDCFIVLFFSIILFSNNCSGRTIILGFDGMDPVLLETWINEGHLPHFKQLKDNGHFQALDTSNPAQSPVAWSSFATGLNPGVHGVFDFIHRDRDTYNPEYSISGIKPPKYFDAFGLNVPYSEEIIYNKRIGKPFWLSAEQRGNLSSVLRVPVTYPPDNIHRMISGMGVPDLLGTQGTFSYFSTKYVDPNSSGGKIVRVNISNNKISTQLAGPPNPFSQKELFVPMAIRKNNKKSVNINLNGETFSLGQKQWSNWVPVSFSYGGVFSIKGMVRLYLEEAFPRFKLYVSPINIDPRNPILPISHPANFANELSQDIGLFHTLGMPEETWSLNDGLIDDKTYLSMVKTVLAEREAMFFNQLDNDQAELLINVFVQTDRVSHMFWRGFDENHPGYEQSSDVARNAILWIYKEADRILGKTINKINKNDKLMVISDHGFAPYYQHVNLNRWLYDEGYIALKQNSSSDNFNLQDIDWTKTTAYAMGLNGVFVNLAGRELHGWVDQNQANQITSELEIKLKQLQSDRIDSKPNNIIRETYRRDEIYHGNQSHNSADLIIGYAKGYRASWQTVLGAAPKEFLIQNNDKWSGDHCIDPSFVPGIFLSNFKPQQPVHKISQIGQLTLSTLDHRVGSKGSYNVGALDLIRIGVSTSLQFIDKLLPSKVTIFIAGFFSALIFIILIKISNPISKIKYFGKITRLLIVVIIVIVLLITTYEQFSNRLIKPGDLISIQAIPEESTQLPELNWYLDTGEILDTIKASEHNQWQVEWQSNNIQLREDDGYVVFNINEKIPSNKVKKTWWHHILSEPGGYFPENSQIYAIKVFSLTQKQPWILLFGIGFIFCLLSLYLVKTLINKYP